MNKIRYVYITNFQQMFSATIFQQNFSWFRQQIVFFTKRDKTKENLENAHTEKKVYFAKQSLN